jgi:hypothetical protein
MREAELKRREAVSGNGPIFFIGALGVLLVVAMIYYITQYVVKDDGYYQNKEYPVNRSLPADDQSNDGQSSATSHQGGSLLITPPRLGFRPTVYFS